MCDRLFFNINDTIGPADENPGGNVNVASRQMSVLCLKPVTVDRSH